MTDIVKQSMEFIWANSGDIVQPDDDKINEGWAVETVPRQWWNWMQNRTDTNVAYLLQKGFPEWDAFTEYFINKSYIQRSGVVYKAILTGTGQDPLLAPTYWTRAFADSSVAIEAVKSLTLAANTMPYFTSTTAATTTALTPFARTILDDADAAAVRTTISAQPLNATLTAVAGTTTATNALIYFTNTNVTATTTLTAFGRSVIGAVDAAAGRTVLELGTASTLTATTSTQDATAGRAVKVGDYGLGNLNFAPALTNVDVTNVPAGWYAVFAPAGTMPVGVTPNGLLEVINLSSGHKYQRFSPVGGSANGLKNEMYIRHYNTTTTTWNTWALVLNSLTVGNAAFATITTSDTDATAGRLTKVGDFGWGTGGVNLIKSVVNTQRPSGNYFAQGFDGVPGDVTPDGIDGYILHQTHPEPAFVDFAARQFRPAFGNEMYIQWKDIEGWSAWAKLFHTQNVATFAKTLLETETLADAKFLMGLEDSGWLTPTLINSYYQATIPNNLQYRKSNGAVQVTGSCSRSSEALNSTIFVLPEGFRPSKPLNFMGYKVGANLQTQPVSFTIATNGAVNVFVLAGYFTSTLSNPTTYNFSTTFVV